MESSIKRVRYFLLTALIFILIGFVFCLTHDKIALHLAINKYHSGFLDVFFKNITTLGDGAFALILLPYLLFFTKSRKFFFSFSTCLLAGFFAQFFKKIIFTEAFRPAKLIPLQDLHLVHGVHLHTAHAFPSGHTTSAFAFFMLLAYFTGKYKTTQIFFGILAVLAGFSRVYLSQHFLGDVVFGAFLGILSFLITYAIFLRLHYPFLEQSLFNLLISNKRYILSLKERLASRRFF